MKKYYCMPFAGSLPILYSVLLILWWMLPWKEAGSGGISGFLTFWGLTLLGIAGIVYTVVPSIRRVVIGQDALVCKGLFPRHTFKLVYTQCNVGMDYHFQNGNKVWWIYLCYGPLSQYRTKNSSERINAIKIRPGFVRIIYSEDVYEALIAVLPKKQKTGLITARRCAGFENQGKIIF